MPFASSERNANCVLNGLMLFGYKSDGSTSAARLQITHKTCQYFKIDYWGQLAIAFKLCRGGPATRGSLQSTAGHERTQRE